MDNEVVVEDENEGTILTFDDAENVSVDDIMYLLQGTGSNRDRKISLGALITWIAGRLESGPTLGSLLFSKDHTSFKNISFIDGDGIEINNAKNDSEEALTESLRVNLKTDFLQFAKTANSVLRETIHTADGFEFRRGTGNNRTKATISLDLTTNKLQIQVLNGLEIKGAHLEPERLNLGSEKCLFSVSTDSDIDTLVSGTQFAASEGDIVVVRNTSGGDLTLSIGYYESNQHYTIQLNAFCSMAFIRTGVTTGTGVRWSPLCAATVEVA